MEDAARVLQSLLIGRHCHAKVGLLPQLGFLPSVRRAEIAHREKVEEVISFLELQRYRDQLIANLPYGVRKIIELGRALCTEPKLLLLDEPSSDLNTEETEGMINFEGTDINGLTADKVMRRGMCHSPEGREVFPFLTVHENLMMGAYTRHDKDEVARDLEMCFGYFPRLQERAAQRAGQLSGGEQRMLAISRALMGRPKLLLLDEPSLGLSPILTLQIFDIVRRINRERGVAILLVEQNAHMALKTADYGYVLEVGRIVLEGECARLMETDDIKEFYLGQKDEGVRGQRRYRRKKQWR